jgi:hypothetical protein
MDFPTLSRSANHNNFNETLAYDPSIKSQFEDGAVLSRARFTTTKKKWNVQYNYLTDTDKSLLETLQETVMVGADTFNWTNPEDSSTYPVRLAEPIQFKMEPRELDLWEARLTLVEA